MRGDKIRTGHCHTSQQLDRIKVMRKHNRLDDNMSQTFDETGPSASAASASRASHAEVSRSVVPVADKMIQTVAIPPPNRFGIKPGPRWDGIARSNGFEDELYGMESSKQRKADDRYRASVSDW